MKKIMIAALIAGGMALPAAASEAGPRYQTPVYSAANAVSVSQLASEACATGKKVYKTEVKSKVRLFNGRLQPKAVKTQKAVCQ